jgi:hypothetical protein
VEQHILDRLYTQRSQFFSRPWTDTA